MRSFKLFLAISIAICAFGYAHAQNWIKIEGTEPFINDIYVTENEPDKIFVAADNDEISDPFNPLNDIVSFPQIGGGLIISDNRGNSFSEIKLPTLSVYAIMQHPENNNQYFAAIRRITRNGITISNDGGNTWNETPPFLCDGTYQIMSIATNSIHYPDIYAAGLKTDDGFFHTDNNFSSCNSTESLSIQSRSVAVSPTIKGLVFLAADAFYNRGVYRSYDKGQKWMKDSLGIENLRIHCVVPSKYDPAVVYCGADSVTNAHEVVGKGVYMSRDTGKTWTNVGAFGASCLDIAEHPYQKEFVIAACGEHGVFLSGSEGWGYEDLSDGLPDGAIVTKVAFPYWDDVEEGKVVALVGTYGDGLYKSIPIYTSVNGNEPLGRRISINSIYPNPASSKITASVSFRESTIGSIALFDIFGNQVSLIDNKYFGVGDNVITIDIPESVSNGVYYLIIKAGNDRLTKIINVMR
jgi:hypothetical protein